LQVSEEDAQDSEDDVELTEEEAERQVSVWSGVARQYCPTEPVWCSVVTDHHDVFGLASHAVGVACRVED
jgi:hypothetical protein